MTAPMILAEAPSLPSKPVDALGRPVYWVWLTGAPGFDYRGAPVKVNGAWIDRRIKDFVAMTSRGYRPPILREHRAEGEREGDVLQLARVDGPDGPALIGAVALSDPAAASKVASGRIRYVSPSFGDLRDDSGAEYTFALREVSLVAAPHQKSGGTHVLASEESSMDQASKPADGAAPSVEDRVSAMESRLGAMEMGQQRIMQMMEKLMPAEGELEVEIKPPAEGVAMSEGDKRLATLERELAAERTARRRAEFDARYPVGASIQLSEDVRDQMFALSEAAPKAFTAVAAKATLPTAGAAQPPRRSEIQWGASLGAASGSAAQPEGVNLAELDEEGLMTLAEKTTKSTDVNIILAEYTRLQTQRAGKK
jgi:hypothetical protein